MDTPREEQAISDARANLTELVSSVRLLRRCVFLTRRDKPQAAIVPVELGEAVMAVGGPEVAIEILARAAKRSTQG